jgi:glycosyltransferase involved in cell wall biosynthesis
MEDNTVITIGITAFREGSLLNRAWQSVIDQTTNRWRAVLVLDGGADTDTLQIFDSINHPSLIKYKAEHNLGPYLSRTKAIELTETEWFYFLDGDDTLPSDAISNWLSSVTNEAAYYYGNVHLRNLNNRDEILERPKFDLEEIILNKRAPAVVAFKKQLFIELGGYDRNLLRGKADMDFLFKIFKSNFSGVYLPKVVYNYHLREQSVSRSYNSLAGFKSYVIFRNHMELFNDKRYLSSFVAPDLIFSYIRYLEADKRMLSMIYALRIKQYVYNEIGFKIKLLINLPYSIQRFLLLIRKCF